MGQPGMRIVPPQAAAWEMLEGEALRRHPDPLGALQRGDVPGLMLRRFVPQSEVDRMLSRMAQMTVKVFTCRFPANTSALDVRGRKKRPVLSTDPHCQELNSLGGTAGLTWVHWCALLTNVRYDCERAGRSDTPECMALRTDHPVFGICQKKRPRNIKGYQRAKATSNEFGQKLYGNLNPGNKRTFMRWATGVNGLHDLLGRGCNGRSCSPKQAMLAGVQELVGPTRTVQQALEGSTDQGQPHSPGTIRSMQKGWLTPFHMDSKHSSAWAHLREDLCGEKVKFSLGTNPREAASYGALSRHPFAASAILTLHAPERTKNPIDLNIFRTRYPALLANCSVRTKDSYGVGVRLFEETVPQTLFREPLTVRADAGDLFLFNSEFFHDTPTLTGDSPRTVFNSFAGFALDNGPVEVYA